MGGGGGRGKGTFYYLIAAMHDILVKNVHGVFCSGEAKPVPQSHTGGALEFPRKIPATGSQN